MSASERIQELMDRTCGPKVTATVTVDQVYAEYQHEGLEFRHPRGGRAKYLEEPMMAEHDGWIERFAGKLLDEGQRAAENWADVGRDAAKVVETNAPLEFGDLRNSAGLLVKEGGAVVANVPPRQVRLSDEELHAKEHMRDMGLSYR